MDQPAKPAKPEKLEKLALDRIGRLEVWRPQGWRRWPWLQMLVTSRGGGHSLPPYAQLNLSLSTGDQPASVHRNRDLLCESLQLHPEALRSVDQVHGARVVPVSSVRGRIRADGLWMRTTGEVLVIGVADCIPVFLWDQKLRHLALVHAGWRGAAGGIVAIAVETLRESGSSVSDLWMAQGPSIGPCCYEVGAEVAERFAPRLRVRSAQAWHLDLRGANRQQALDLGLARSHILADPPCTACNTELWFSHRKQGPRTGRMWALAWRTQ